MVVLLSLSSIASAKEYSIDLNIADIPIDQNISISFKNSIEKRFEHVSTKKTTGTNITFKLAENSKIGIYTIRSKVLQLDIIFDKEDVEISTTYLTAKKNIKVNKSRQNKLFFELVNSLDNDKSKQILFVKALNLYSIDDKFYTILVKELKNIEANNPARIRDKIRKDKSLKDSYLVKLLNAKK